MVGVHGACEIAWNIEGMISMVVNGMSKFVGGNMTLSQRLRVLRSEEPRPLEDDRVSARRYCEGIYKDTGCSEGGEVISSSCLQCPLPSCKYDYPEGVALYRRDMEVMERKFDKV